MGLEEILYLRFANTMLEPVWNRNYLGVRPDHDGRELRRRGPRPLLRPGRGAARRGRQPPVAAARRRPRWSRPRAATRTRSRTRSSPCSARWPTPTPRTTCAASTTATCEIDGVAPRLDHRDLRRAAAEIDNWRWAGVPFFIRTGKQLPVHPDRAAAGVQAPATLALHRAPAAAVRSRARSCSGSIPSTGIRIVLDAHRADEPGRGRDRARHGVRAGGRRGPDPVRGAAARGADRATAPTSRARTWSRRPGGSCSRCSTRRRRSIPYEPGVVGPAGGRQAGQRASAAGTARGCRND